MTSVASEPSIVSPRPARAERLPRPNGTHDGFAALVDIETRAEPKPSAKPAAPAKACDEARPTDRIDENPAADETMPAGVPAEANQSAPVESGKDEVSGDAAFMAVSDSAADRDPTPDPSTIVTAAPAVPAVDSSAPTVTPAIIPPASPAPEKAAPETTDPLEASTPAPRAPEAPKPVAPQQAAQVSDKAAAESGADAQASVQSGADVPQTKARATPAVDNSGEALPETAEETALPGQTPTAQGTKQPKELPSQAAPVRPDPVAGRSSTQSDVTVTAEEPAPAKPAVDLNTPLATPAHAAQPASIHAATIHAAPVSAAQPVPVNAIAVEIAAQARAGNSRFEIRLDPPELGRIDVRLDVDRDGNVSSRLVIERADTYDLLRRDQSTLERALQQAGLKTSDNALEFSLRDQGFAQHRNSDNLPRGLQLQVQDAETTPGEAASGYARLIGLRGGIDIRV